MAQPGDLHDTLMHFAERTNDLICSANSKLESLISRTSAPDLIAIADDVFGPDYNPEEFTAGSSGERSSKKTRLDKFSLEDGTKKPPSIRPVLPVEIVDSIFSLVGQRQLYPVLCSNSFLSQIALRRIYHTILIETPKECVVFLKNILSNPALPPLVRSLELSIAHNKKLTKLAIDSPPPPPPAPANANANAGLTSSSSSTIPLFTHNFYILLRRALREMHSLTSLTLELPKSHSPFWIFHGCTFKLRQFTTSMHCLRPLAAFLETQETIEELSLRGFQSESLFFLPFLGAAASAFVAFGVGHPQQGQDPTTTTTTSTDSDSTSTTKNPNAYFSFTLSPTALPRLKSFNAIHAGPSIIHTVMEGRSVEVASIPLFPERSIPTLDALGSGKASLKRLSVISFDPGAPEFLFEELATRFKNLEALHMVMLMADYTRDILEDSGRILSNFTSLKYITFMAASTDEASIDESKIAKLWHQACPTLRTIILPKGRVWFQGEPGGEMQVDPDDMSSPEDGDAVVPAGTTENLEA